MAKSYGNKKKGNYLEEKKYGLWRFEKKIDSENGAEKRLHGFIVSPQKKTKWWRNKERQMAKEIDNMVGLWRIKSKKRPGWKGLSGPYSWKTKWHYAWRCPALWIDNTAGLWRVKKSKKRPGWKGLSGPYSWKTIVALCLAVPRPIHSCSSRLPPSSLSRIFYLLKNEKKSHKICSDL